MKKSRLSLILLFMIATTLFGQNRVSIISDKTITALNNEISGELAQDYIRHIGHYHRLQPSEGYRKSAEWVAEAARNAGLSDVQIEEYPSDGTNRYYMYGTAQAWDAEFGEFWLIDPQEEKLTSFAEIPTSLAITSQSCDVMGELVWVGIGTSEKDYENINVKGKIVFAEGSIGSVASLAVDKFGALGVLVINQRYSYDEPDNVSSLRIRTQTPSFGFGLSHRRGEELKTRILRGEKMTARAMVKTKTHSYPYENVIATIPGTDLSKEEILLVAHLCHYKPGANDNGSGSATILEIGRALRRLIDEGKIKQPKRTIRFLWVPEMAGSIAYAATHPDLVKNTIGGINFDMVGQYLNDNNSTFFVNCTPHSQPHYINDLLTNITEFVASHNVQPLSTRGKSIFIYSLSGSRDAFRYRIFEYVGGSDQWIFNDGLLDVPMPFFLVWPDRFYHTSGDKPEICDPTQLKRASFLGAAAVTFLMDDCPHKARFLAGEVFSRANMRIIGELKRTHDLLNKSTKEQIHENHKEAINIIDQAYEREAATLQSVKEYSQRDLEVDNYVDDLVKKLQASEKNHSKDVSNYYTFSCNALQIVPQKIVITSEEKVADKIYPKRNPDLKGPLGRGYLQEKLEGKNINTDLPINQMDGRITHEILNFVNGKKSILDIRNAVSAEYEPVPVNWVEEFLDVLAKADIVRL